MSDESNNHTGFPCSSCGAQLTFQPGTAQLTCPYCNHAQKVENPLSRDNQSPAPLIKEYDYLEVLNNPVTIAANEMITNAKEVECKNCGAITLVTGQAENCPFCDSPMVVIESKEGLIVPESLLPFRIEKSRAQGIFREWIKSRWFAPNDLIKKAQKEGMDGVYLPYWTYDSQTSSRYRGERGEHYYEEEESTDSDGNTQTTRERRTRWYSVSGDINQDFDDVMVCASKSLPQELFDALEPWPINELKNYNEGYLAGFLAEKYGITLKEGFGLAEQKMDAAIRQAIKKDIGGDEQRIHGVDTEHDDIKFKLILLPLWISSFRYKEKIYRFLVNAQTGEANGERPYSTIKIVLLILAIVSIFALFAYLN